MTYLEIRFEARIVMLIYQCFVMGAGRVVLCEQFDKLLTRVHRGVCLY
jgi:hypothetical protein